MILLVMFLYIVINYREVEEQKTFEQLLAELSPFYAANKRIAKLETLNAQRDPWLRKLYTEVMKCRDKILTKWDAPEILLWWAEHKLGAENCYSFLSNEHRLGNINGNLVCENKTILNNKIVLIKFSIVLLVICLCFDVQKIHSLLGLNREASRNCGCCCPRD